MWDLLFLALCIHCIISDDLLLASIKRFKILGLLCGIVDRTPSANVGDMGSIPGPGRFHLHLSWGTTTTEACVPRVCGPQQQKPQQ